jgi:hypothetical protein
VRMQLVAAREQRFCLANIDLAIFAPDQKQF